MFELRSSASHPCFLIQLFFWVLAPELPAKRFRGGRGVKLPPYQCCENYTMGIRATTEYDLSTLPQTTLGRPEVRGPSYGLNESSSLGRGHNCIMSCRPAVYTTDISSQPAAQLSLPQTALGRPAVWCPRCGLDKSSSLGRGHNCTLLSTCWIYDWY